MGKEPSIAGPGHPDENPELSLAEIARYSRRLILPEVGIRGQIRLKAETILIAEAGGLGSPLALYLARPFSAARDDAAHNRIGILAPSRPPARQSDVVQPHFKCPATYVSASVKRCA